MRSGEVVERIVWSVLFGTVMLASAHTNAATVDMFDGQWRYSVTPYGWLPDINGKFRFDVPAGQGGSPEVHANPDGYLSDLKFVAMISGEARKGPMAFAMDLIYLDLGDVESRVNAVQGALGLVSIPIDSTIRTDVKALVWQGVASYT